MTGWRSAVVGMLVIGSALLIFNLILYGVLPPSQPKPAQPQAERARRAAEQRGQLAGFYDFDGTRGGQAWFEPEIDRMDDSDYQWSAQLDADLTLPVGCDGPWVVEYAVWDSLYYPPIPSVRLSLNGQPLQTDVQRIERRWVYRAVVTAASAGQWRLTFSVDKLVRPNDVLVMHLPAHLRYLGAPLDWVLVTSEGC